MFSLPPSHIKKNQSKIMLTFFVSPSWALPGLSSCFLNGCHIFSSRQSHYTSTSMKMRYFNNTANKRDLGVEGEEVQSPIFHSIKVHFKNYFPRFFFFFFLWPMTRRTAWNVHSELGWDAYIAQIKLLKYIDSPLGLLDGVCCCCSVYI